MSTAEQQARYLESHRAAINARRRERWLARKEAVNASRRAARAAAGKSPRYRSIIADPIERFWSRVEKTDGCWLWTGGTGSGRSGEGHYGVTLWGDRNRLAHRVAYELLIGPIPDGLVIDHLCRNRLCVNPAHMEPVTNRENVLRGVGASARAARQTLCIRGHLLTTRISAGRPRRGCKTCARVSQNERRRRYGRNGRAPFSEVA